VALLVLEMPTGTGKKTVALILISLGSNLSSMRWTRAGVDVVGGRADAAGHAAEVAGGRGFTRAGGRGLYTLLRSALAVAELNS